jgi:hypothetical protein
MGIENWSLKGNAERDTNLLHFVPPEEDIMAVRVGFEPTEPVKVQRFSRPPDSTALAPHRFRILPFPNNLDQLSVVR